MASSVGSEATTIGDNVGLVAAMIAVVVAQVLKPFSDWTVTGRFKAGLMVGSGGFPSSHSSLVTALATGAAYQSGLGDPAFATALVLALVVRAAPSRVASPIATSVNTPPRIPRASRPREKRRDIARRVISLAREKKGTVFFFAKTRVDVRAALFFATERNATDTSPDSSSPFDRCHGHALRFAKKKRAGDEHQVMYDAMGVRRQAGYHATAINNLVTAFPSEAAFGRRAAETDALEAGLVTGGYQSGGGGDETNASNDERFGRGERGGRNVDEIRARDENRDSDALLGGMDEVAETFQQGFQDFLTALQERPLREHIGHTPVQVLAGGVLGVVVGTAYALALRGEAGTH